MQIGNFQGTALENVRVPRMVIVRSDFKSGESLTARGFMPRSPMNREVRSEEAPLLYQDPQPIFWRDPSERTGV